MNEPSCSFYAIEHGYTQLVLVNKKSIKYPFVWVMAFMHFFLLLTFSYEKKYFLTRIFLQIHKLHEKNYFTTTIFILLH